MFNRFRDGLVNARLLIEYRKDAMWKVVVYIVFFAVLFSSASIVDVIKYDGLTEVYKENVRQSMTDVTEDCAIANAELVCDSEYKIELYEDQIVTFYLDSHSELDFERYADSGYAIVIHKELVYVSVNGLEVYSYLINDLDPSVHNLDFSDQADNTNVFYDSIFNAVDKFAVQYKAAWGSLIIIIEVLISFAVYMMFIMLSAYFLRKRFSVVPFKQLFAMTTYSSTGLFVILIFDSIFELNLFLIVILIIFAFRQNNALSAEIEKRLKNKS
jgi:hypothetical protein